MAPKAPLRSLSLFLLDRRIERWEEALRSTGGLHEHRLKSDSGVDGVLYLRPQGRKAPNWVGFIEPHVEDEGALRSLFNASTSAVLFLAAGGRRFAIVFGQGRHLLDPDSFEYDFGLRVVLNAVEPERLKSIDAKRFDERTMHTRRDSSREASFAKLKRDHVEAVDAASGVARRRWPVYACLVYDTRLDGDLYVLSGKQWFRISESFDQEITEFVEALPETDLPLPDAPQKIIEDDYNVLAAEAIGALCTHPQLVHVAGRDAVELCDILTSDRRFIHVKRRGASSTLSHLFAQGVVSAELYLDDQRFRDGAAELLERLGASADMLSRERPNPGEWEVAYVVLTRGVRKDTPYTLPFFSLANLASSARRLQDRGFKVSIAEVREV